MNEFVIHDSRVEIADAIREQAGVTGVAHHEEKPQLLLVGFDPNQVHDHQRPALGCVFIC